ncbi:EAL domain-containing protein, partial [Acinetobacter baumannii]
GMILPGSFLSVLEATGLIVPVGHWILGQCVTDCEYWASFGLPKLRVAVNVSALQLRRKTFVPTVLELNDRLSARCGWGLDLEITESIVLQDL